MADEAPEPQDDTKRKFREALERKKANQGGAPAARVEAPSSPMRTVRPSSAAHSGERAADRISGGWPSRRPLRSVTAPPFRR